MKKILSSVFLMSFSVIFFSLTAFASSRIPYTDEFLVSNSITYSNTYSECEGQVTLTTDQLLNLARDSEKVETTEFDNAISAGRYLITQSVNLPSLQSPVLYVLNSDDLADYQITQSQTTFMNSYDSAFLLTTSAANYDVYNFQFNNATIYDDACKLEVSDYYQNRTQSVPISSTTYDYSLNEFTHNLGSNRRAEYYYFAGNFVAAIPIQLLTDYDATANPNSSWSTTGDNFLATALSDLENSDRKPQETANGCITDCVDYDITQLDPNAIANQLTGDSGNWFTDLFSNSTFAQMMPNNSSTCSYLPTVYAIFKNSNATATTTNGVPNGSWQATGVYCAVFDAQTRERNTAVAYFILALLTLLLLFKVTRSLSGDSLPISPMPDNTAASPSPLPSTIHDAAQARPAQDYVKGRWKR